MKLGLSGALTRATIRSPLTPLFLLTAIALGILAVLTIPREEEPQISVPMVDIAVRADGLRAPDAAELVTKPLETIVKGIDGVEHVYSQTQDDSVLVTARFIVGTKQEVAITRIRDKIAANLNMAWPIGRATAKTEHSRVSLSPMVSPSPAALWPADRDGSRGWVH